jgi:hypothetical protein
LPGLGVQKARNPPAFVFETPVPPLRASCHPGRRHPAYAALAVAGQSAESPQRPRKSRGRARGKPAPAARYGCTRPRRIA